MIKLRHSDRLTVCIIVINDQALNVVGIRPLFGKDLRSGEVIEVRNTVDGLFNLTLPIAGILAVGSYKFLDREMLVGAMPIHIGISVEIFSYLVCSLCENVRPKLLYVNLYFVPAKILYPTIQLK